MQSKTSRRQIRERLSELVAAGRHQDLLEMLSPETAAAHIALHDGDVESAGAALCTPYPTRPLVEAYVLGDAKQTLRVLQSVKRICQRPDLLERLRSTSIVLVD
jgi:hypothetical protein